MSKDNEPVEFEDIELIFISENAWKCSIDDKEIWIPISQMLEGTTEQPDIGDTITIVIPEWLAVEKELV